MPAIPISFRLYNLTETESTNLYAIAQIHAGLANHGHVYYTPRQTGGKGQRGKQWVTQHDKNLTLSLVLQTDHLPISQHFRLSAAVALSAAQYYKQAGASNVTIKWPNDIFINDRKAGGILIENVLQAGTWRWSVAGIGLNINQLQFAPPLSRATSLSIATGKYYPLDEQMNMLLHTLNHYWLELQNGGWKNMLAQYNACLFGRDMICRIRKDNAVIPCLIRRVNEQGTLLAGEMEEWQFDFGEASWVLD